MMRGTKRLSMSDSTPVFGSNTTSKQSKRVTFELPFNGQQEATQSLNVERAESSRKHVKALNTQFASWVQAQLLNHPDELWEDGVQDYLNHAKSIMEKFSDVVNWLKINGEKADRSGELQSNDPPVNSTFEINTNCHKPLSDKSLFPPVKSTSGTDTNSHKPFLDKPLFPPAKSTSGMDTNSHNPFVDKPLFPPEKSTSGNDTSSHNPFVDKPLFPPEKSTSGTDTSSHKLYLEKPGFPPATTSFGTSWRPGSLFNNNDNKNNNNTPFTFGGVPVSIPGNANSFLANQDASNDADEEDDVEQPSSPSVKKSEEKGILVVYEVKCKLFVKSIDPADKDAWKDRGMGQLSIKCKEGISKGTKESKPTIVVRNDVGKIVLNASLYSGIKTNKQKNSVVAIFHIPSDGDNDVIVPRTFLIRVKTEEDRDKLAAAIQDYAPAV